MIRQVNGAMSDVHPITRRAGIIALSRGDPRSKPEAKLQPSIRDRGI